MQAVMHRGIAVFSLDSAELGPAQKAAATEVAAAGREFLQRFIGGPDSRRALFRRGLRCHHVVVALLDGQFAGLASYKHRQKGPMAPRLGDFIRTFGASAFGPWLAYHYAEAKLRSRGLYICGIDVFDGYQRRGVGSALIAELARTARKLDADVIELDVRLGNDRARAFYRALGFTPPDYPLLSIDRLNTATNGSFQRLALSIGPRSD